MGLDIPVLELRPDSPWASWILGWEAFGLKKPSPSLEPGALVGVLTVPHTRVGFSKWANC